MNKFLLSIAALPLLVGTLSAQTTLNRLPLWLAGPNDCNHAIYNNLNSPCGAPVPTGSTDSEYINYLSGLVFIPRVSGQPSYFDQNGNFILNGNLGVATNTPDKPLTVLGSINARGTVGYFVDQGKLSLTGGTAVINDATADGGTAMLRASNQPNDTMWFGPYTPLPAGNYIVQFRVKVASNASSNPILRLDAINANSLTYASITIRPSDFRVGGDWETFTLPITVDNGQGALEFRGMDFISGITDFYLDYINVLPGDARGYYSGQFSLSPGGNMGIGISRAGARLEVNGNVKLTAGSGASISYPDGTVQSTAWNGTTSGGDYAESVDVGGNRKAYEPGDVIVIDVNTPGKFLKSSEPYSTTIAGIYSTKPGLTGRRQLAPKSEGEVPMAMMGIVPTKVSDENGPIQPGDFLVTSSRPGYAMKGTNRNRMFGAVVGKAMGNLDSGSGVIEVLVSLQ